MHIPPTTDLTIAELRTVTRAVNILGGRDLETIVGIAANEHWIVLNIGERHMGFWRTTMKLYAADENGAMGDEEIEY